VADTTTTLEEPIVTITAPAPAATAVLPEAPRRSRRGLLLTGGRIAVAVLIAGFLAYAIVNMWPDVRHTWSTLAWPSVVLALMAVLAGFCANTMAWRAAVADLECTVGVVDAGRIQFVGNLAKYLPGSVWSVVLQMELGRRAGLPRARAFLASLLAMGLGITASLLVGTLALPSLLAATHHTGYGATVRVGLYVLVVLVPVALVCSIPWVLTRLVQVVLRLLRRRPLSHELSWSGVLKVVGWTAVGYAFFGIQLWLLANAAAEPGPAGLLRATGAMALAMVLGTFAVFSPSGLGVREAVLVAALAPFLATQGTDGVGAALGIAVASRVVFTAADLVAAAAAGLSSLRLLHRTTPAR
jgi:hypothetical protein